MEYNDEVLTFKFHANIQTLLESTVWASFPLGFIDMTLSLGHACVHFFILHRTLEETLARFAGEQTVVVAGHFVRTNRTQLLKAILHIGLITCVERITNRWQQCWYVCILSGVL